MQVSDFVVWCKGAKWTTQAAKDSEIDCVYIQMCKISSSPQDTSIKKCLTSTIDYQFLVLYVCHASINPKYIYIYAYNKGWWMDPVGIFGDVGLYD